MPIAQITSPEVNLTVVYADARRPCAICGVPSDTLWHARKDGIEPTLDAPGVCADCVASAMVALVADRMRSAR